MTILHLGLILATLLCSLVAGFVFAFASVTMPGLGELNDREFLRSFQVIDRVIQNRQPLFGLVWIGSMVAMLIAGWLGFRQLEGIDRLLVIGAVVIYFLGVQLPTMTINIPLNNQLQTLDLQTMSEVDLAAARKDFEALWNRWNVIRTILASLTSLLLIIALVRL